MTYHQKTQQAAKGKWRGLLMAVGVNESYLTGKHTACPMCGGKDRFRWANLEGNGTYICNQCGAGSGFQLAMAVTGKQFPEVAKQIDALLGNQKFEPDQIKPVMTDEQQRALLREAWGQTKQMAPGDLADKYFTARQINEPVTYPKDLRFATALRDGEGGIRPCMVAMVRGPDGSPVTLHRTFLRADGLAKAEMASPRKLMPGTVPDGAAVRLSDYHGGALGIAEGIETAFAAMRYFDMPVWAALNKTMLTKWEPPEGCEEVAIFGDNDANFAGQSGAYVLANRLALKKITVTVHIPEQADEDFWDVWIKRKTLW